MFRCRRLAWKSDRVPSSFSIHRVTDFTDLWSDRGLGTNGNSVFFQAEDGIRDIGVTGVQTCALPISLVTDYAGTTYICDAISEVADNAVPVYSCELFKCCAELDEWVCEAQEEGLLGTKFTGLERSEEHTSELQSRQYLVCRLLLEKKKKHIIILTVSH